jgi:hypothetical protein
MGYTELLLAPYICVYVCLCVYISGVCIYIYISMNISVLLRPPALLPSCPPALLPKNTES